MQSLIIIPLVFLALIFVLFFWAIIFMKGAKQDKQRLTTILSEDKDALKQESLYLDMAESYEKKGDLDKALEYYYLYLRKSPNSSIYFHVGNLLSQTSIEQAIEYWNKAAVLGHKQAVEKLASVEKEK